MSHNRLIPGDAAEPRKRFAQNLLLEPQLLRSRDVLVVAAAAFLIMSALCFFALFRRGSDLQQFCPDQFLLSRFRVCAHLFPGKNIWHENGISIGERQALTSCYELLNR